MAESGEGSDKGKKPASPLSSPKKNQHLSVVLKHARMIRKSEEDFGSLISLSEANDLVDGDPKYCSLTLERVTNVEGRNLHSSTPTQSVQGEFGAREIYQKYGVASSGLGTSAMVITDQRKTELSLSPPEAQAAPRGQEIFVGSLAAQQDSSTRLAQNQALQQAQARVLDSPKMKISSQHSAFNSLIFNAADPGLPAEPVSPQGTVGSVAAALAPRCLVESIQLEEEKSFPDSEPFSYAKPDPPQNLVPMKRKIPTERADGGHEKGASPVSNNISIREQQPSSKTKAQNGNRDDTNSSDADSSLGRKWNS